MRWRAKRRGRRTPGTVGVLCALAVVVALLAARAADAPGQPLAHPLFASLSASPSSVGPGGSVGMTLTIGASVSDPGIKVREVDIDHPEEAVYHGGSTSGFTSSNPSDNGSTWSWTGLDVHLINPSGPPRASMSFSFSAPTTPGSYSFSATVIADGAADGGASTSITVTGVTLPTLSIGDASVAEGNAGTTTATFPVTLSQASSSAVSVSYSTVDGTATAGSDYSSASGTVTFAPGETSKTVGVTVNGDTVHEGDETFLVDLSGASGATIADGQAVGTIVDDDALPALSIENATVVEGNSGSTTASFPVTLSNPSASTVTVGYATADGSAKAGSDYTATSGTLTFAPGETVASIEVGVLGDTAHESTETFTVDLSSPVGATLADGSAVGTILDDDGTGPDMALTKQAGETQVTVGDTVSYTIQATNVGTQTADGVVVSDPLPGGLTLVGVSSTQGTCSGSSCSLGPVGEGESAIVTVSARATSAGTRTNTASVSTLDADPNGGNNTASAVVHVAAQEGGAPPPPLPPPEAGEVNVEPTGNVGSQCIQTIGSLGCMPLSEGVQVPINEIALIDPGTSSVSIQGIEGKSTFYGTPFSVRELTSGRPVLVVQLLGGQFDRICRSSPKTKTAPDARAPALALKSKKPVRRLWGRGKGRFRTQGRYSAGTVRGTWWETIDRCDGTVTHVRQGIVDVYDLVLRKHVLVKAGRSYLASPAKKRKKK